MNAYQRYLLQEFADEYHGRRMSWRDLLRRDVALAAELNDVLITLDNEQLERGRAITRVERPA